MEMNGRTYQNVILTAIAVLLLVLVAQTPSRIGLSTTALAQPAPAAPSATSTSGRVGLFKPASSEAEVEMARQMGEVAKAIQMVAHSIDGLNGSLKQP